MTGSYLIGNGVFHMFNKYAVGDNRKGGRDGGDPEKVELEFEEYPDSDELDSTRRTDRDRLNSDINPINNSIDNPSVNITGETIDNLNPYNPNPQFRHKDYLLNNTKINPLINNTDETIDYTNPNPQFRHECKQNKHGYPIQTIGLPLPKIALFPANCLNFNWAGGERGTGPGLVNLWNTCFMNSVLQVLSYTPPLWDFLINNINNNIYNKDFIINESNHTGFCAHCALAKLFLDMRTSSKPVSPNYIAQNITLINRDMRIGRQEDAHEFLLSYLNSMREHFLIPKPIDKYTEHTQLIDNIFGGWTRNTVTCLKCAHASISFDPFLILHLDIEKCNNLTHALSLFFSEQAVCGGGVDCDGCKKPTQAKLRTDIEHAPNFLIIQLKRFKHNNNYISKNKNNINFELELDLAQFGKHAQCMKYRLYAAVVHMGSGCGSGHYYAYAESAHNQWLNLNDSSVNPVGLNRVLDDSAYLLFYRKITPNIIKPLKNKISAGNINNPSNPLNQNSPINQLKNKNKNNPANFDNPLNPIPENNKLYNQKNNYPANLDNPLNPVDQLKNQKNNISSNTHNPVNPLKNNQNNTNMSKNSSSHSFSSHYENPAKNLNKSGSLDSAHVRAKNSSDSAELSLSRNSSDLSYAAAESPPEIQTAREAVTSTNRATWDGKNRTYIQSSYKPLQCNMNSNWSSNGNKERPISFYDYDIDSNSYSNNLNPSQNSSKKHKKKNRGYRSASALFKPNPFQNAYDRKYSASYNPPYKKQNGYTNTF